MSSNLLLFVTIRAIDFCILVLCPGTSLNLSYLTHSYYTLILSCSFWYNLMMLSLHSGKKTFCKTAAKEAIFFLKHLLSDETTGNT